MAGTVHVSSPSVHTSPAGETLHLDEESSVQQTLQDLPVSYKTVAQTFVMGMARIVNKCWSSLRLICSLDTHSSSLPSSVVSP